MSRSSGRRDTTRYPVPGAGGAPLRGPAPEVHDETISVTAAYKCDVGVYKVPVVLPEGDEYTMIVYEFSGKDANGNPDVLRKAIRTPWAE